MAFDRRKAKTVFNAMTPIQQDLIFKALDLMYNGFDIRDREVYYALTEDQKEVVGITIGAAISEVFNRV